MRGRTVENEMTACRQNSAPDYGLADIHRASLGILKEIDRICRKYGIQYMIDSGTLLGAVRHGGFIPWDDDADVAFTRENYEAFAKVVHKELPEGMYFLEPVEFAGRNAFYDFTPRVLYLNSRTRADSAEMQFYGGKLNHLWVDLFILDELPEKPLAARRAKLCQVLLYGLAMGHRYSLDYGKYGAAGRLAVRVLSAAGKLLPMKTIIKLQHAAAVRDRKGKSRLMFYSNYQPDFLYVTVEKDWSGEAADMRFEDTVLMAPKNWDQVLKQIYGDYMTLPPEEKRVPTHSDGWLTITGGAAGS